MRKTANGGSVRHVSQLERWPFANASLQFAAPIGKKRLFCPLTHPKLSTNFWTKNQDKRRIHASRQQEKHKLDGYKKGSSGIWSDKRPTLVFALRRGNNEFPETRRSPTDRREVIKRIDIIVLRLPIGTNFR